MEDSITTESSTMSSLEPKVPEVSACDSVSQNCSESVKSHDSESNLIGTSEDSSDAATVSPSPPQTPMTWAKGKEGFDSLNGSENNGFYQTNLTIPEKDVKDLFKQPYNELLVPVNQSKKGLRSGKLYVTKELGSEKGCCRKYFCWITLAILLLTGIILGILAIAGVFDTASNVDNPAELKGDKQHLDINYNDLTDDLIINPGEEEKLSDKSESRAADIQGPGFDNDLNEFELSPQPALETEDGAVRNLPGDKPQDPSFTPEDSENSPNHELHPSGELLPAPEESLPAPEESQPAPEESQPAPEESQPAPEEPLPAPEAPLPVPEEIAPDSVSPVSGDADGETTILEKIEDAEPQPDVPSVEEASKLPEAEVEASKVTKEPIKIDEPVEVRPVDTALLPEPAVPIPEPEVTLGQILQTPGPHVPDILDAEFKITNLEFSPALENQSSVEYQTLANELETELRRLLIPQRLIDAKEYDFRLGVVQFKAGSVICHFRVGWFLLPGVQVVGLPFTPESLRDTLALSLASTNGLFLNYVVPVESVVVYRVTDVCSATPSFCGDLICGFSYDQISFACTCPPGYILSEDNLYCNPVPKQDLPWTPVGAVPESANNTQEEGAFEEVFLVPTTRNSSTPVIEDGFLPIVTPSDEDIKINVTGKVEDVQAPVVDEVQEVVAKNGTENVEDDNVALGIEPRIPNSEAGRENRTQTEDDEMTVVELTETLGGEEIVDEESDKIASEAVEEIVEDVTEITEVDFGPLDVVANSSELPPSNVSTTEPPPETLYDYEQPEAERENIAEDEADKVIADDTPQKSDAVSQVDNKTGGEANKISDEEVDMVDQPADKVSIEPSIVDASDAPKVEETVATSSSPFDLIGKDAANATEIEEVEYVEYEEPIENPAELGLEVMEGLGDTTFLKRTIESEPSEQLIPATDKPSIEFLSEPCGNWPLDLESSVFSTRLGASLVEWPSLARLFIVEARKSCTAVIIDKDWVLAAYSCVKKSDQDVDPKKWVLFAGGPSARGRAAPNTQIRTVDELIINPEAEKNGESSKMVLVKLNKPLSFSESLRAICVTSHAVEERQACTVVGWQHGLGRGDVTFSQYSKFLTSTKVNTSNCDIEAEQDNSNLICSEITEDDGICLADDGAPMMCVGRGGFWELGGLYSRSSNCSLEKSNLIFTAVSGRTPFQWVKETIRR